MANYLNETDNKYCLILILNGQFNFQTGQGHCNACHKKLGSPTTNYVTVEKPR